MDDFNVWPTNSESLIVECMRCRWTWDAEEHTDRATVSLATLVKVASDHRIDGCPS